MDPFATSHLSNRAVLHDLKTLDAHDRRTTAVMLTRIAEAQDRKLFLQEGFSSMHAYCEGELHWCEGTASRRIAAAHAARRFPVVLNAVTEGRVHVTGVLMLSRYLTSGNVDELLEAATHKSKAEIAMLIAERFPQPDVPEMLRPIAPPPIPVIDTLQGESSPEKIHASIPPTALPTQVLASASSPEKIEPQAARSELRPIAPERFAFQGTFDRETYDLIQEVRALLGHEIPLGEAVLVIKRALRIAKIQLLKEKHGVTDRPGHSRGSASARTIPREVRRAVWARDGGKCAFVSENGRRCEARASLEYDHIEPVARGGQATAENVRLLCRAHNRYAAERAFGADFMDRKRREARARGRSAPRTARQRIR